MTVVFNRTPVMLKMASYSIKSFYKKLLKSFGPQGWWPTTPSRSQTPRYRPGKSLLKNKEGEKFEICLGAILTQNTSWNNVTKVLSKLKRSNLLRFKPLSTLPLKKLYSYLKSSGYFRQKSKRVKKFLKAVQRETGGHFGRFLKGPTLQVREKLLHLHGIGPETADSMMLYAAGHPLFVVDAYTRRIGSRWKIFKETESYQKIQAVFMSSLPPSPALYGEFHALLVRLAKDFCQKRPLCHQCPVQKDCPTGKKEIS